MVQKIYLYSITYFFLFSFFCLAESLNNSSTTRFGDKNYSNNIYSIAKEGIHPLKIYGKEGIYLESNNINLRKITIYLSILGSTSYFVIWLYQEALEVLNVPDEMFGVYRMVLLVAEIIMIRVGAILIKKCNIKKVYIGIAIVVAIGFIIAAVLQNILGVIFLLVLAGGLGLQVSSLLSKELNEEIDSKQRATVLSFTSMVRRLLLTVFNPFIGYLVDSKGVFIAFAILGVVSLLGVFLKPKFKLK